MILSSTALNVALWDRQTPSYWSLVYTYKVLRNLIGHGIEADQYIITPMYL